MRRRHALTLKRGVAVEMVEAFEPWVLPEEYLEIFLALESTQFGTDYLEAPEESWETLAIPGQQKLN